MLKAARRSRAANSASSSDSATPTVGRLPAESSASAGDDAVKLACTIPRQLQSQREDILSTTMKKLLGAIGRLAVNANAGTQKVDAIRSKEETNCQPMSEWFFHANYNADQIGYTCCRDHFGSSDQRFADRCGCVTARQLRQSPLPVFLTAIARSGSRIRRARNKCVEDPAAAEAVMMFVSHCPDPGLALSFQFKPAEQWTAAENTIMVSDDPAPNIPKQIELSSEPTELQIPSPVLVQHVECVGPKSTPHILTACAIGFVVTASNPDILKVIVQRRQALKHFLLPVKLNSPCVEGSLLNGLLDSGSMACTLSTEAESKLCADGVLPQPSAIPGNVVLVGCGGLTIQPKCTYDLEVEVYGFKFIVPTLLVPGQKDEFIIGSNIIKCVLQKMKAEKKYWELISCQNSNPEREQFLKLLSCVSPLIWFLSA
ncbi:hypothetical protein QQF64_034160 [Cirrhinus molitorella]|uniref:Peptidase A2 domain-containing protein n=1 Tax=Cirrhinus molitorella TaxID=172907 RepID=A0ABR3MVZ5_9TELE